MSSINPQWRKSSKCQSDGCVEVAEVGDKVAMGKDGSHRMTVDRQEWRDFVDAVKAGEFDDLTWPVDSFEYRLAHRRQPGDPDYDAFYDATDDQLAEMVNAL